MTDIDRIIHILESATAGDFAQQIDEKDIDPALQPILSPLRDCLEKMQGDEEEIREEK
jgi:hypothetical protein